MSLPPDPHDDDLTGTYPEVGGRGPSGPPPPPPPVPPPGSPVTDDVTPLANAAAALGRDLGRAGPPSAADGPPAPPAADPGDGASPAAGPPGRRRGLVLAAAGVAVAVVVAGVVFALAGGDDEPTASGDDDAAAADAPASDDDAGSAGAAGGEATDSGSGGDDGNGAGSSGAASGGSITDNSGESPVEAAEAMFTAAIAGDCEGVVARMTPEAYAPEGETPAEAVAECEADLDRNELLGAELQDVTAVSEDGDAAVVSVTLAIGDETGTQDVPMVRLDDGWKVDIAQ
jgi:hypothetical protein